MCVTCLFLWPSGASFDQSLTIIGPKIICPLYLNYLLSNQPFIPALIINFIVILDSLKTISDNFGNLYNSATNMPFSISCYFRNIKTKQQSCFILVTCLAGFLHPTYCDKHVIEVSIEYRKHLVVVPSVSACLTNSKAVRYHHVWYYRDIRCIRVGKCKHVTPLNHRTRYPHF